MQFVFEMQIEESSKDCDIFAAALEEPSVKIPVDIL